MNPVTNPTMTSSSPALCAERIVDPDAQPTAGCACKAKAIETPRVFPRSGATSLARLTVEARQDRLEKGVLDRLDDDLDGARLGAVDRAEIGAMVATSLRGAFFRIFETPSTALS